MESAELSLAALVEIENGQKFLPPFDVRPGARDTVLVLPTIRPPPSTKVSVERQRTASS